MDRPLTVVRKALASDYAFVNAAFVINRAILHRAGMRLNFILDWMHLSDPEDLRTHLFDTLYFTHAYPPGMSLLTGLVFKISESHAPQVAYAMLYACGLVLVNSLFYLSRAFGLSRGAAIVLAIAFSLVPQTIYFEHLYLYTYPTAALLSLSAVLFHRAVKRGSFWRWTGFFAACAAIGWLRSTFHLVWFLAMFGLAAAFSARADRRRLALAALGPGLVLLALYGKNLVVFGVFGSMTFGSGNLTTVTVRRLPPEVREAWTREGKLSALASVDIFAGPRAYLPYFETSQNDKWPPMMNRLENPTTGAPNFNHWFFLQTSQRRRDDSLFYLKELPLEYAGTVVESLKNMFQPTTEWHPWDKTEKSPHLQHREVLGRYERLYNKVVHSFPVAPVGLYAFLPFAIVWAIRRAVSLVRHPSADTTAGGALLVFCLVQIVFVVTASTLFTFGETARYRYAIEPMIWLVGAISFAALAARPIRMLCSRGGWPLRPKRVA
jgi:hypothetical protein